MGESGEKIRVLLVDDHPMWRETLRKVVERAGVGVVVGEAGDGPEAVAAATELAPDVVVMDIDLPTMSGIETTRAVVEVAPDARILILSGSEARDNVVDAVQAGASGYLLKTAGSDEIRDAVERIGMGEMVFPPALASVVLQQMRIGADDASRARPSTVTLLFTDIEGSTTLAEQAGRGWSAALAEHREVLRDAFGGADGTEIGSQGDACLWEFRRAEDAIRAALAGQRSLASHAWGHGIPIAVRIGVHTGEPDVVDDEYEGADLNRASRICDAGHGGQIVVSQVTRHLLGTRLDGTARFRPLGRFRLRGFRVPEDLFDVVPDGTEPDFAALRSAYAEPVEVDG